ncbi:unnamed protein product, partial [Brenthis ino]
MKQRRSISGIEHARFVIGAAVGRGRGGDVCEEQSEGPHHRRAKTTSRPYLTRDFTTTNNTLYHRSSTRIARDLNILHR